MTDFVAAPRTCAANSAKLPLLPLIEEGICKYDTMDDSSIPFWDLGWGSFRPFVSVEAFS